MTALVFVPDLETWVLAMGLVFGGGGVLVMAIGAIQIIRRERQLDRAAETDRDVEFDSTTYPGRTIQ